MDDTVRKFGEEFAAKILERDWAAAHKMLSPSLQKLADLGALQSFVEKEYRATLESSQISEMHYPGNPEPMIDGNTFVTAAEIKKPDPYALSQLSKPPADISDENLKYWMSIQFLCSEDQQTKLGLDFLAEIWIAVISTPDGLRAAHLHAAY